MTYSLLLFVHIMTFAMAFSLTGMLVIGSRRLHAAYERRDAQSALAALSKTGMMFPVVGLLLLGTGVAMTHIRWSFSDGWVIAGIAAIVLMLINGALIVGGRQRALARVLANAPNGILSADVREMLHDRMHDVAENVNVGLAVGVSLIMVLKTPLAQSLSVAVACAIVAGGATAIVGARRPAVTSVLES